MTVEIGSVWDDNDPREAGRTIEVVGFSGEVALVRLNTVARNVSRRSIGRRTRIRLDRLGTDYTLSEVKPHRTGRHKGHGELGYYPVDQIAEA